MQFVLELLSAVCFVICFVVSFLHFGVNIFLSEKSRVQPIVSYAATAGAEENVVALLRTKPLEIDWENASRMREINSEGGKQL